VARIETPWGIFYGHYRCGSLDGKKKRKKKRGKKDKQGKTAV
jgi:hypothetical protein